MLSKADLFDEGDRWTRGQRGKVLTTRHIVSCILCAVLVATGACTSSEPDSEIGNEDTLQVHMSISVANGPATELQLDLTLNEEAYIPVSAPYRITVTPTLAELSPLDVPSWIRNVEGFRDLTENARGQKVDLLFKRYDEDGEPIDEGTWLMVVLAYGQVASGVTTAARRSENEYDDLWVAVAPIFP